MAVALTLSGCSGGGDTAARGTDASTSAFCQRYLDGLRQFERARDAIEAQDPKQRLTEVREAQEKSYRNLLAPPVPAEVRSDVVGLQAYWRDLLRRRVIAPSRA